MGLPKFVGSWVGSLKQNFVVHGVPPVVSSLAIDLNSSLYVAFGRGTGMEAEETQMTDAATGKRTYKRDINGASAVARRKLLMNMGDHAKELAFKHLFAILVNTLLATYPRDTLILAIDGVVPMAKQLTQRDRRFRSSKEHVVAKTFDFNGFTPGTDIMNEIDQRIRLWIEENKNRRIRRVNDNGIEEDVPLLPATIIYSSHMDPGEGEQKIMNFYREGRIHTDVPINEMRGTHILMGLDADLVVLALNVGVRNLMVSFTNEMIPREGAFTSPELLGIGRGNKGMVKLMDIDILRRAVASKLGHTIGEELGNAFMESNPELQQVLDDFVLILSLAGNDFLPGQPALADLSLGIEPLLDAYRTTKLPLTVSMGSAKDVHWPNFAAYMRNLFPKEATMLAARLTRKYTFPFSMAQQSVVMASDGILKFNYNNFRAAWYERLYGPRDPSMQPFLDGLLSMVGTSTDALMGFSSERLQQALKDTTTDYLNGIAWVFAYYTRGQSAVNHLWFYKYRYTPLLFDVAAAAGAVGSTIQVNNYRALDGVIDMNCLHQMLNVLPLESAFLVPAAIRPWMNASGPLADLYPASFLIEAEGVDEQRHGVSLLNFPDPVRVFELIAQTTLPVDVLAKTAPVEATTWIITEMEKRDRISRETQYALRIRDNRPGSSRGSYRGGKYDSGRGSGSGSAGRGYRRKEADLVVRAPAKSEEYRRGHGPTLASGPYQPPAPVTLDYRPSAISPNVPPTVPIVTVPGPKPSSDKKGKGERKEGGRGRGGSRGGARGGSRGYARGGYVVSTGGSAAPYLPPAEVGQPSTGVLRFQVPQ